MRWRWIVYLLPGVAALILWQFGGRLALDIGSANDQTVLRGFYDRESSDFDGSSFRWSSPEAAIGFAAPRFPAVAQLRGKVPTDGTRTRLGLGQGAALAMPATTRPTETRIFHLYWPDSLSLAGRAELLIEAEVPAQTLETRPLGLMVDGLRVDSIAPSFTLPPAWVLAFFLALPGLIGWCLGMAGAHPGLAVITGLLAGAALVWAWHLDPRWVQPFVPVLALGLLSVAGVFWWVGRLRTRQDIAPVAALLLVFVACAGLIPLYTWYRYGFNLWLHWLPVAAAGLALALPFAPARARPWLAGAIGLLVLAYGLYGYGAVFEKDYADDFKALFRGPRAFLKGEPLYDLAAIEANHLGNSYKYPPFFVLLMAPLTGIPFGPAIQLWRAANIACLIGAAGLLWRGGGRPLRSWSSLGLLLLLMSLQPINDSLRYGQVDCIILLGVAAAYWAVSTGRWGWAGAALALPIAIKIYPAFLLLHAAVLRRWRAPLAAAIAVLALTALAIALLGWPVHATYFASVLPASGGGTGWIENQTLNGFLNRLGASSAALLPDAGGAVRWLTYLGALALSALAAQRTLRRDAGASFGLWVVTLLIVMPISWIHYEALLIVPLFHLFVVAERRAQPLDRRMVFVYAAACMLLAYGNQWTFFGRIWLGPAWAFVLSYKWYGMLLLWAGLAYDPLFSAESPAESPRLLSRAARRVLGRRPAG